MSGSFEPIDTSSKGTMSARTEDTTNELDWSIFPHRTVLPGLQFSLAGVIGKPETFYSVPAVLFAMEMLSYL